MEAVLIQCAFAWRECPDCQDSGLPEEQHRGVQYNECPTCKGTGKQYALPDSVRGGCLCGTPDGGACVACYDKNRTENRLLNGEATGRGPRYSYEVPWDHSDCGPCDGRGSVPTTDAWAWLEAVKGFHCTIAHIDGKWRVGMATDEYRWVYNISLEVAFFEALAKALVAQGYTLLEVE